MDDEPSKFEFPLALAALRLTLQNTGALLESGLLSPGKRRECAEALQDLHRDLEDLATDPELAVQALAGVRDLIDRLSVQQ